MKNRIFYLSTLILFLVACSGGNDDNFNPNPVDTVDKVDTVDTSGETPEAPTSSDWLIPISQVKDGGPGKDGIPSIDSPKFVNATDPGADFLKDDDLVIGIIVGNEVRAYPHLILDWHEVVNDKFDSESITISYCPLTGTAFAWNSVSNGVESTFGVSGLIYNANLILYDRNTGSRWSQLKLKCVNGELKGDEPTLKNVVETNWGTWKALYPNTKVLSLDTGFSRNYALYPYGSYRTDQNFFVFSATPLNDALLYKERVHAIISEDESKVYQYRKFRDGKIFKDQFKGNQYLVVGNENLIYSYELNESQSNLNFEYGFTNTETFFKDDEGNKWSIFGKALEGPRTGEVLKPSRSVIRYWFVLASFYLNPIVFVN